MKLNGSMANCRHKTNHWGSFFFFLAFPTQFLWQTATEQTRDILTRSFWLVIADVGAFDRAENLAKLGFLDEAKISYGPRIWNFDHNYTIYSWNEIIKNCVFYLCREVWNHYKCCKTAFPRNKNDIQKYLKLALEIFIRLIWNCAAGKTHWFG